MIKGKKKSKLIFLLPLHMCAGRRMGARASQPRRRATTAQWRRCSCSVTRLCLLPCCHCRRRRHRRRCPQVRAIGGWLASPIVHWLLRKKKIFFGRILAYWWGGHTFATVSVAVRRGRERGEKREERFRSHSTALWKRWKKCSLLLPPTAAGGSIFGSGGIGVFATVELQHS